MLSDGSRKAHGTAARGARTCMVGRLHRRDYDHSDASGDDDVLNRGGR